jgi:hypothetical protein
MKQKDIALIAVVVFMSGVLALVISNIFFSSKEDKQQKAEIVDVITADFPTPPSKYFNSNSIDPTQLIQIGESNNTNPFKDQQ